MEGIDKLGFTFNFSNLFVNQRAPVQGPHTRLDSGVGYGPMPSGFIGGRIAPRVVLVGGIYIETGYGSSFDDVTCVDGDEVVDGVPDTNPATCTNGAPQDLNVTFFVGEFAVGTSFKIHEKFWLGVALRLPFSKQVADLWQNIGAALVPPGSNTANYGRVKNDLGGVGAPALRFGATIKPHKKVNIGVMYRMASNIKMTGTTVTDLISDPVTGGPLTLNAVADWNIPHAIQFGVSWTPTTKLLLALESRLQFHGADKTGNKNQTVSTTDPNGNVPDFSIVVPFGWKTAWSVKLGAEYRLNPLFAVRGGAAVSESATTEAWAQNFTPPAGLSGYLSAGFGFYWDDRNNPDIKDKYMLDLAGSFAFSGGSISDEFVANNSPATVPGTSEMVDLCSRDQVVRTGCPGDYRVLTYWFSLGFTIQY
jgi:long-subunit fatty acid transport protein